MKTNRKKTLMMSLLLGTLFFLGGCSNDGYNDLSTKVETEKTISTQYDYLDLPTGYKQIGQFHNEGMDSVYNAIKKAIFAQSITKSTGESTENGSINIKEIIDKEALNYCNNNKLLKKYTNSITSRSIDNTDKNIATDLSSSQKKYINKIYDAIKKSYLCDDLSNLKDELNNINQEADNELSLNESQYIKICSSVAYSSAQYWKQNKEKWYYILHINEFENDSKSTRIKTRAELPEVVVIGEAPTWLKFENWWNENGASIVGSDCVGALTGAVAGARVGSSGLIFGPEGLIVAGTGAAVTGAVITAITASATSAGEDTVNWHSLFGF